MSARRLAMPRDDGLARLEARVAHDLEILDYPHQDWLPPATHPSGEHVYDVVICGAGQSGLAIAFGLMREQVRNILVIDAAPEGREGVWSTVARMRTLRTPKYLSGPEMGLASLSYRAWHETQRDMPPWDKLERIATADWAAYLTWFRRVTKAPVENETRLIAITGEEAELIGLTIERHGSSRRILTRKLVLANGMDGGGKWNTPAALVQDIPRRYWRHSSEEFDFAPLAGKLVGVLGFGASAIDCAATALEYGARRADVFSRRTSLPVFGEARQWLEQTGFLRHFADLDVERRWRLMLRYHAKGSPPPRWSIDRARRHEGFGMHLGAPWRSVRQDGEKVIVTTPLGEFTFDFIIFATGLITDLSFRDELSGLASLAAAWGDRYQPPADEANEEIARHPFLSDGFALCERHAGTAPWLSDVHLFNWGATTSVGINASSISGMKFGVSRLITALTRDLYLKVADAHAAQLPNFETDCEE